MHELSVAIEICHLAERSAGAAGPAAVRVVAVEMGDDAGLEPANLSFCLETLLAAPPFGMARPLLQRVPGHDLRVAWLEVDDGRPDN
jgi:Zn finger protein HypA/HybF involved in hydrogenase expression